MLELPDPNTQYQSRDSSQLQRNGVGILTELVKKMYKGYYDLNNIALASAYPTGCFDILTVLKQR